MQRGAASSLFSGVGKGPTGVIKSILDTSRTDGKVREEIFVDIVEKISCTFSSSGSVQNSQVDGAIQVRTHCPSATSAFVLQPPVLTAISPWQLLYVMLSLSRCVSA